MPPPIARALRSLAVLCAALALLPFAALGKEGLGDEKTSGPVAGPLIGSKIPRDKLGRLSDTPGANTLSVLAELADEPTIAIYTRSRASRGEAQARNEARQQLDRVRQAQTRFASAMAPLGARELYRVGRVANGVAVRVPRSQLAALAALPGVKALWPLVPKRIDNATSIPLIGAPAVWGGTKSATGAGTTIAIIDTGIDYLHPDFGGSGLQADYDAIDTTVRAPFFPTAKVVEGRDLVGDDYDAESPINGTPKPDPNPIDCVKDPNPAYFGHGSHVAGTAAGFGVLKSGTTYNGAYTGALDFSQFRIGPGVAPEAKLYAYRVFGCAGSSEVVAAAIDAAIDPNGDGDPSDHVDVINMSLGINYGANVDYPGDPDITATEAAVKAGVVVVASAGNAGDTYYVAGGPSSADGAISVASSDDGGSVTDGFRVTAPNAIAGDYPAANSLLWSWDNKPDVAAKLVYPPDQRNGCAPFSPSNAALLVGNIVLLDWAGDSCSSTDRVNNAAAAGAKGVILVYDNPVVDFHPGGSARIPAVLTSPSVGKTLIGALAGQTVNVALTKELIDGLHLDNPELRDTLSSFSSRGPRSLDGALKPDITAPGQTIFSVKIGQGGRGQSLSGTSMAAPHVAGTLALLRQLHPTYSVAELKALAMNTATNDLRAAASPNAQIYGPARVGAGRVDVPGAAAATVLAYNAANPELVSVSFGSLQVVTTTSVLKRVTVANKGASAATFDVAYNPVATVPGAAYTIAPATLTLTPGASATVSVTLAVDASLTRHTHDPTVSETQAGEGAQWGRSWQSEASGYLTLANANSKLRVPVHAAVRAASSTHSTLARMEASDAAITLTGEDVLNVVSPTNPLLNAPVDDVSLVSAFELQSASPRLAGASAITASTDLRYVGVTSDFRRTITPGEPNGALDLATIYFGIATYGDWTTLGRDKFEVDLDVDRDGTNDYALFNTTPTGSASDIHVSALCPLNARGKCAEDTTVVGYVNVLESGKANTNALDNSVLVLPLPLSEIPELQQGASRFNYSVASFDYYFDRTDTTPTLSYDPAKPGIDLSNADVAFGPLHLDLNGGAIPFAYSPANYAANGSRGVLLLHHHGADAGARAEVVGVGSRVLLPVVAR